MANSEAVSKEDYLSAVKNFNFTKREKELGFLKVNGFTNQRIAEMYGISVTTVKKHFTHMYEKAWVPGRKEFIEILLKKLNK